MSDTGAAADARVHIESAGSIEGHSVQAGEIHGDVHLHQAPAARTTPVPRQLPGAARHFVNRAVEQDALTTLLNGTKIEGVVLISTVDGTAGIGKSTLVVHWAHRVRERFPDGELYVNLRGFDPGAEPVSPADALASFLMALGVRTEQLPAQPDDRAAMFRSLVHGKRMLVLLDNARSGDQVRPLLPGDPSCLVLVTSRNRLDDLVIREGASRVTLDLLSQQEALDLVGRYVGRERLDAEPQAVAALVEHCAGLPLALGIVAVRAAENPDFPLDDLVEELQNEHNRLDSLDAGGETGVRAVFSWSYRSLSVDAARLFRLLGLPTGPDISLAAAADLTGTSEQDARKLLAELTRAHLVEQHEPGRYQFHDLLRAYAAECAAADESADTRHAAIRRMADHYLRTSGGVEQQLAAHARKFVPARPESEVPGRSFDTDDDAVKWWDTEKANVLAAARQASAAGLHEHAWQIPHTLMYYFNLRNLTDDWVASYDLGLTSARQLRDDLAEAHLLADLAGRYYALKDYEQAAKRWEHALPLLEKAGERSLYSMGLISHGYCYLRLEQYGDTVRELLERGLELQSDDRNGQGYAHAGLGILHSGLQQHGESFAHFREALRLYREVGEKWGEGFVLNNLAEAYFHAGQLDEAVETYRHAVEHRRGIGHRLGEATSLRGLGTALREVGDVVGAPESWHEAWETFDGLGAPEADDVRAQVAALGS